MKRSIKGIALSLAILLITFSSCTKKKDAEPTSDPAAGTKYSAMVIVGSWPNTAYYLVDVPSFDSGEITLKGNGAEMTAEVYAQDVIQKDGYYYHANAGSGQLGKYHVESGKLVTDKKVPFTLLDWSSYTWIDNTTLALFGTNGDQNEGKYAIIETSNLQVLSSGTLDLVDLPTGFVAYAIGFAEYRDGKVFLNYGFRGSWDNYPTMLVPEKGYVAVFNYATKTVEKSAESASMTTPGGPTVYAPTSFIDENKDLYFITDPVYHYDNTTPSKVYRIKNGSTEIDASYDFNFSSQVNNGMGAAFWYIGNGKAIVRTRVAGTSIDAEHSFSLIDVHSGTFIKKLALPADVGERMVQAVVVDNGKAYIAVNGTAKDYIAIYDPATDQLTEGAQFTGGIDYLIRIEKKK